MQEKALAEKLEKLRRETDFLWMKNCKKAYEVISDHMLDGVPQWYGLLYGGSGKPEILCKKRYDSLRKGIEKLREGSGITHFKLALSSSEPFLYKILENGQDEDVTIEEFKWGGNRWDNVGDGGIRNDLTLLHEEVLWPGFFSGKENRLDSSCMSLVLGYKASKLVIGIWAFHALLKHPQNSSLSDDVNLLMPGLLYPPIYCLNAALADRFEESERQRWDLALLAQNALVGRRVFERALRNDIREHPKNVPYLVKEIIERSFEMDPDRYCNYRRVFDKLLEFAAKKADVSVPVESSRKVAALRECFVGWHMGTREIRGRRTELDLDDAYSFIERAIRQAQTEKIPMKKTEDIVRKYVSESNPKRFLRFLASLLFSEAAIEDEEAQPNERLAFLVLAKILVEDFSPKEFGELDDADQAIKTVLGWETDAR